MNMKNPPHPGRILKLYYVDPLKMAMKMTIEDVAGYLDIHRSRLSTLLNEGMSVSPLMAFRLSIGFDTTPDYWMNLQSQFDLALTKGEKALKKVKPIPQEGLEAPV